jgi:hypothetical protein
VPYFSWFDIYLALFHPLLADYAKAVLVIIYRLAFHPLKAFPGPVLARITNAYGIRYVWRKESHLFGLELHGKYGETIYTLNTAVTDLRTASNSTDPNNRLRRQSRTKPPDI